MPPHAVPSPVKVRVKADYTLPSGVPGAPARWAFRSTDKVPEMRRGAVLVALSCRKVVSGGATRAVRVFMVWSERDFAAHAQYLLRSPGVHDPGYCIEEVIISPAKAPELGGISVNPYIDIDIKIGDNAAVAALSAADQRATVLRMVCRACEVGVAQLTAWLPPAAAAAAGSEAGGAPPLAVTPVVTDGSRPGKLSFHVVWRCGTPDGARVCVMRNVACAHALAAVVDAALVLEFGPLAAGAVDRVVYKDSSQNMRIMGARKVGTACEEVAGSELRHCDPRTGVTRSLGDIVRAEGVDAAVRTLRSSLITYVESSREEVLYYSVEPWAEAGGIKRARSTGSESSVKSSPRSPYPALRDVTGGGGGSGRDVLTDLADAVGEGVLQAQGLPAEAQPVLWSGVLGTTLVVRLNSHQCSLAVHTQTHFKVHVPLLQKEGRGVIVRDACDAAQCREKRALPNSAPPTLVLHGERVCAALREWRAHCTIAP